MKKPAKAASAPTANAIRGEHELELAGVTYRLRPSYAAIVAIEKKTDRTLRTLAARANTGDLTLEQIGIVAAELIRAGSDDALTQAVSAERIAELAFEEGLPHVIARLTLVLIDVLTGGRTVAGEARAPVA